MDIKNSSEIIDRLGGTGRTAVLCDVTSQAVSKWRRNGIPRAQLKFLKVARPEVFGDQVSVLPSGTASDVTVEGRAI